jgi:hypothetical protein
MKFAFAVLLLVSAASALAAPPDRISATGLWKIAGDVYGRPVDLMCQLTQTAQKLSGTCSTATDGFVAHKVDGSVKGEKFQLHFQSAFGSNSIMMIVSGKVNEDGSHVSGDLDVEPIGVGGKFEGERATEADAAVNTPPLASPADAAVSPLTSAPSDVTGFWNIEARFGRIPIHLACQLSQKQHAVAGTCTGEDAVPRTVTGEVTAQRLTWRFQAEYQGQPIDVSMTASVTGEDTAGMRGSMAVAPLNLVAVFNGTRQSGPQPSTAGTPPAP